MLIVFGMIRKDFLTDYGWGEVSLQFTALLNIIFGAWSIWINKHMHIYKFYEDYWIDWKKLLKIKIY